jgi:hypothetical protein
MSLELEASAAPVAETETPAEGAADPKAGAAEATQDPAAAATQNTPAATTETTEPAETEDRRAFRAAQSELAALRAKLKETEEAAAALKPYKDLEAIGREDPSRWLAEMAEAQGVTPQRVLEIIAKRGTGEQATLTAEERVAKLERAWAEREAQIAKEREDNDRRAQENKASETRKSNVSVTAGFIKANAKDLPGLDENDADAVYTVVEQRWADLNQQGRAPTDNKGLQALYLDAAKRVEAAVRAEAERRAVRFGYSKPTTVQVPAANEGFRGLSLSNTTAPATPVDSDRVNTPDDMDALMHRMFS